MELEKVTNNTKGTTNGWYGDACGTALALELVGERWALLVIRELMLGARRFGEIRANLNGISANVLTQRLEKLESVGILVKRRLPPPASVQVYELTDWGYEVEPIFQTMGRWATRSPLHDPTQSLSPVSAMLSMRTMIASPRDDLRLTAAFRFPREAFVATLDKDELAVARGDGDTADLIFETDPTTLVRILYGKWPIAEAEAEGLLRFSGDRAAAQRFVALFSLPKKVR